MPAQPPLTFIHGKAHVECFELRALHEHLHALVSAHLLICGGEPGMEEGTGVSPSPPPPSPPSMPAWMPSAHPMSSDMETSPALSQERLESGEPGAWLPWETPEHNPAASPFCTS